LALTVTAHASETSGSDLAAGKALQALHAVGSGPSSVVIDRRVAKSISTTLVQDFDVFPLGQSGPMTAIGLERSKFRQFQPQ
jgi:hypothetical protein